MNQRGSLGKHNAPDGSQAFFCDGNGSPELAHGLTITAQKDRRSVAHHMLPCKIARGAGSGNAQPPVEHNPN